jgi:hypothetical protein
MKKTMSYRNQVETNRSIEACKCYCKYHTMLMRMSRPILESFMHDVSVCPFLYCMCICVFSSHIYMGL